MIFDVQGVRINEEPTNDWLHLKGEWIMGKYFLAWILGVPAIVLLIIYFIF